MSKNYTVEYLKSHILNYYDEHRKLPKTSDINEKNNCPNRGVFVKYTGVNKWIDVFYELNIDEDLIKQYKIDNNYYEWSKEDLIKELYKFKEEYHKSPKGVDMNNSETYPDSYFFYSRFESNNWNDILNEAGLKSHNITKSDVEEDIHRLVDELNEVPNKDQIQKHGKYAYDTYVKYFDRNIYIIYTILKYIEFNFVEIYGSNRRNI